ncbi:hypothetical protein HZ326_14790 [Fusarium oxysporum f. sp. albedinis]|nr:hypothetical protein HZ326_14790 [Fusarium oxysporum f. sp. albedinis]
MSFEQISDCCSPRNRTWSELDKCIETSIRLALLISKSMPPINPGLEPLTRHACEPCRRKKTKCTAERPVCSYCKRLGDQCHYLPRGRPGSDGGRPRRRAA